MSTEKKIPPIQLAPVKHFTIRLIDGHFVRVPKVENLAVTDVTRPSSEVRQETSAHGDGTLIQRQLRLVDGRFVGGAESVPVQIPPSPVPAAEAPAPAAAPKPVVPAEPLPNSWAYAFGTQLDPADSPPKT